MAQATISLSQSTFQPISATAVHVLARMAARRAVQEQLRADGVRVSLVKPAEISAKAQVYLNQITQKAVLISLMISAQPKGDLIGC